LSTQDDTKPVDRYFVTLGGVEREVCKSDYVNYERAAGFVNTLGQPHEPATASWSSSRTRTEGRIVYGRAAVVLGADDVRTSSTPTPAVPLANIHAALEQCKQAIAELVRAQHALEWMADNQDINDGDGALLNPRFGAP
jgi:hypothetical protein